MDIADIGYDFLGKLVENNLAMPYPEFVLGQDANNFKEPRGPLALSGAISFLVNTDLVKNCGKRGMTFSSPTTRTWYEPRPARVHLRDGSGRSWRPPHRAAARLTCSPGSTGSSGCVTRGCAKGVVLNVATVQKGGMSHLRFVYDFDGFAKCNDNGHRRSR